MRRPSRPPSLLASLFRRIGVLFAAFLLLVGAATFLVARYSVNEMYDDQLVVGANVLHFLMLDELTEAQHSQAVRRAVREGEKPLLSVEDRRAFRSYAEWRMFRVWSGPVLVMQSGAGPPQQAPPPEDGFRDAWQDGIDWRIYVLRVPAHDLVVEVGERAEIRHRLVWQILLVLAVPLALLAPIAAVLIWVALRGGLQALRALLADLGRRSPRDLSAIGLAGWPRDLHPLIRSINGLFGRIEGSLQHERRFLDDAAHQLRTPLASVKLQAQMAAEETDPAERLALISGLLASVDRASTLTADLLTLARLDAEDVAADAAGGDLRVETLAVLADLAPLAARHEVALSLEDDADGALEGGDPVLLRLVLSNLVENAIHHAPVGSEVAVRLSREDGRPRMTVIDAGPGISEAEREHVLQRFRRGRNVKSAGSGLGLSIVVAALDLLGGKLALGRRHDGRPGLQASVELAGDIPTRA